jgi:hypothetical protein
MTAINVYLRNFVVRIWRIGHVEFYTVRTYITMLILDEDNITMNFEEIQCKSADSVQLPQDINNWRDFLKCRKTSGSMKVLKHLMEAISNKTPLFHGFTIMSF